MRASPSQNACVFRQGRGKDVAASGAWRGTSLHLSPVLPMTVEHFRQDHGGAGEDEGIVLEIVGEGSAERDDGLVGPGHGGGGDKNLFDIIGVVGAGGGGFLLFYTHDRARLRSAMADSGMAEVPFMFDFSGSTVIVQ